LGRDLYPELDLWQTAKPFLERWFKDELGPMATLNKLREELPCGRNTGRTYPCWRTAP